jgi:hypothetical protein
MASVLLEMASVLLEMDLELVSVVSQHVSIPIAWQTADSDKSFNKTVSKGSADMPRRNSWPNVNLYGVIPIALLY